MAFLYITEYAGLGIFSGNPSQVVMEPPLAEQAIAIGASSAQSAALQNGTNFVRLHTDSICGVEFGANPTATVQSGGVGSRRLAANQTEYFAIPGYARPYKYAVITTT